MKKTFLLVLLVSLAVGLFAAERTVEDAAAIAAQFTNNQPSLRQAGVAPRTAATMKLAHKCMKKNGTEPAYYVFNQGNDAGFIIVSGDDRTEDVLVYAEQGSFDPEKVNPNFRFWLNRLQEEISFANDDNAVDKVTPRKAVSAIGPLLKNDKGQEITWDQLTPYNNLCPIDEYDNTRSYTGCVATAMAQILYKWRYPEKGTGSKTYTWANANKKTQRETLTVNFGATTYDWANMLPSYYGKSATTAQKNAVATLMYHLGVACEMEYGGNKAGGSGAFTDMMGDGITKYFGYKADKFITTYSKQKYGASAFEPAEYGVTTAKIEQYFNADLEAGRPIIMGGETSDGAGHEFVCDGRNTSGDFHINWGWEGDGNCYCKLSALKPSGTSYNFSSNIDAMIGLRPAQQEVIAVTGVTVAPTSATLKINGKQQLTATIAPANATDKAVTWKSDNTSVATVSESGLVKAIAQGTATITVTTHDGNKTATATITVTNETEEEVYCDDYSYTFTAKCNLGTQTLGDYTWNITCDNANVFLGNSTDKGAQFGSGSQPARSLTFLTSSNCSDCLISEITINASIAKDGDTKLAVYINNQQIGSEATLTTTPADYKFTNTSLHKGALKIVFTNTKKALYIKSINVKGEGDVPPTPKTITIEGLTMVDAVYESDFSAPYWWFQFYKGFDGNDIIPPFVQYICNEDATSGTTIAGTTTAYYTGYWPTWNDSTETDDTEPVGTLTITCVSDGHYNFVGSFVGTDGNTYQWTMSNVVVEAYDAGNDYDPITLTDKAEPTPTALPQININATKSKFILDGRLFIMRDNKLYNAQGQLLR